jgi:hypothetical protein
MRTDERQNRIKSDPRFFTVVIEPDEDRWHAYAPALSQYAAATWGSTLRKCSKTSRSWSRW